MVDQKQDVVLRWESIHDIFDEFLPLFNRHYMEIYNKEVSVSRDFFEGAEDRGAMFTLAARTLEGEPVGYYVCVILPSIYNTSELESRDLGIYVEPKFREQGVTTVMQKTMDTILKEEGVDSLLVSYPKESSIPVKAGYEVKEIIYERRL